jgi:hypothetical protein
MLDHRRSNYIRIFLFLFSVGLGSMCAIAAEDATIVREVGQIKLKTLREISGIAASRQNSDILWVHNDGSARLVFAVKTTGKLAALVGFPVEIEDFEDIAIGPGPTAGADYLYIGDIGDNTAERQKIRVVRFAEPQVSKTRGGQIEVETAEEFGLTYPDGAHNAEALLVDPVSHDVFIVTKEKGDALVFGCRASRLKDRAVVPLELLLTLKIGRISGGDIGRDGSRIILRREDKGWLWKRGQNQSVAAALQTLPQEIPVRGRNQGQNGEAVAFSPDGNSYYTVSEGKQQIICEFQLPKPSAASSR